MEMNSDYPWRMLSNLFPEGAAGMSVVSPQHHSHHARQHMAPSIPLSFINIFCNPGVNSRKHLAI
eukprot:4759516-Amphidinium_carterae.1